jgi:hypothetical protein
MWIFDFQIDSFALSEKSPIYYAQKFPEYGRQAGSPPVRQRRTHPALCRI